MSPLRYLAGSLVLMAAALAAAPAKAVFHLWYIKEIYSNESGSVQFIELFSTSNSQDETNGEQITSGSNTFTFNANTGNPTLNKHLLLATESFTSLPGAVPPDFPTIPLPPNFFSPAGDTLTFVGTFSSPRTFGAVPAGNVNSLNYSGSGAVAPLIRVNSPTNFAGGVAGTGSINRGDYNGDGFVDAADYTHWRKTLAQAASPAGVGADGNTDGTINDGDYTVWTRRFGDAIVGGSGGSGIVTAPEPATLSLALVAWAILIPRRRLRS